MEILNYIVENALILVPVLNIIGTIIKHTEKIPDKYIPLIILVVAIGGALGIMGLSFNSVVQGVLVAGVAVYGNQIVKQLSA